MRRLVTETRIPDRGLMFVAFDMREQGATVSHIAATVGRAESTVAGWLSHPDRFDPYLDEVALERAMAGDRKVFEHLTIYELEEFYNRLEMRLQREPYDNKLYYPAYETTGRAGTRSPFWLHDLAKRLGVEGTSLTRTLQRRRQEAA